jgi:hypothetical protein
MWLADARVRVSLIATSSLLFCSRSSGTEFREIRVIAEFLAEVPVQEQGACWREPSSSDWTWQAKTLEVSLLMESIKRVGWAWDMNQGGHECVCFYFCTALPLS